MGDMKETDRRRGPNNKERATPARDADKRDRKLQEKSGGRNLKAKESSAKPSSNKPEKNNKVVTHSNTSAEPSEVYEDMVVDYVDDDLSRSEDDSSQSAKGSQMEGVSGNENFNDNSSDMEIADESDPETINDSVSSQGDSQMADEDRADKVAKVPKKIANANTPRSKSSDIKTNTQHNKARKENPIREAKPEKGTKLATKSSSDNSRISKLNLKPLPESSSGASDKPIEQASSCEHNVCSDDEAVNTEEHEDKAALDQKIEEMETRIKNLESELREVAALEISLYSVVPEHCSSAHKVHTPARRLSRLYIHACKHWCQDKRATAARNTVSGLALVAKSCSNDVSKCVLANSVWLTFWLSNTVVLREIVSQTFGSSCHFSALAKVDSDAGVKKNEIKSLPKKSGSLNGSRQLKDQGFLQFVDDWQETRTFTAALEKVESWIFLRIVESVWWQTLTPNMQSPVGNSTPRKVSERLLGPALGNQQQGSFSINLWNNAFHESLKRLCPVRAVGNECGCLPVLAKKVLGQCIGRLDVVMFNAILRESAHEIPTDPVSDPIVDSMVLPIPAGDLSFGSGAQLKNSVGNWARWLSVNLGMDDDNSARNEKEGHENKEHECFPLLNALSDLLMLPKDMLMDRSVRMEVCPSISLPLVKRVLCNFTPDEFWPDPVPGAVLEALNAECIIERRLSGDSTSSFPYPAAPVMYRPPSSSDVAQNVSEASNTTSELSQSASSVQKKGYTSDEELDEVESCLTSIIDKSSSPVNENGERGKVRYGGAGNARYNLLREVWQAT